MYNIFPGSRRYELSGELFFCLPHSVILLPTILLNALFLKSSVSIFLRNMSVLVDHSAALDVGTSHSSGLWDIFSGVSLLLHKRRLAFPVFLANNSITNHKYWKSLLP